MQPSAILSNPVCKESAKFMKMIFRKCHNYFEVPMLYSVHTDPPLILKLSPWLFELSLSTPSSPCHLSLLSYHHFLSSNYHHHHHHLHNHHRRRYPVLVKDASIAINHDHHDDCHYHHPHHLSLPP